MKALMLAMLAMSAPVAAQDAPVELWGGLKVGASWADLLALYPKHRTQLTPECKVEVYGDFATQGANLKSVILQGSGFTDCGRLVREGLRAKYGEPVETTEQIVGVAEKTAEYHFVGKTVSVQMTLATNNPAGAIPFGNYKVTYTPRSVAEGMASKL